jgi:hypothetical protein
MGGELAADAAWAAQIGPVLTEPDVGRLLDVPAVDLARRRLLRVRTRDGAVGYPAFQFDGARALPGLEDVIAVFDGVVSSPLTVASWLTAPRAELAGRCHADLLRDGDVERVVVAARQTAADLRA